MSDKKYDVAIFANIDGKKTQVGWATEAVDGVRSTERLPGYEDFPLRDVTFSDEEPTVGVHVHDETTDVESEPKTIGITTVTDGGDSVITNFTAEEQAEWDALNAEESFDEEESDDDDTDADIQDEEE